MKLVYNTSSKSNSYTSNKISFRRKIITFSTCWYVLKSKFSIKQYLKWIKNFLSIVNNFYLVIYTNKESFVFLSPLIDKRNKNIKIIIKPIEEFYTYKYKELWIKNHEMSDMELHKKTDWELNMLWNEKVFFVNETITNKYFDTMYYGWCDIGYFRNRTNDLHTKYLTKWPNNNKLLVCGNKIQYGCVQNNITTYMNLFNDITKHYEYKLTIQPIIKFDEICFAGGFFVLKKSLIEIYVKEYDKKLVYYFNNNFIIKDDQTIIMDIIFNNPNMFYTHREANTRFDNWFMFQRLLI
jgi:hypothetical protein